MILKCEIKKLLLESIIDKFFVAVLPLSTLGSGEDPALGNDCAAAHVGTRFGLNGDLVTRLADWNLHPVDDSGVSAVFVFGVHQNGRTDAGNAGEKDCKLHCIVLRGRIWKSWKSW